MFTGQLRYGRDPSVVVRTGGATFYAPLRWQRSLETTDGGRLVFTCSWSDWFHTDADAWRDEAWAIIRQCPNLTFQILTKRPELMRSRLPANWGTGYGNVWLGVSVENRRFTWRIDELANVPAVVRFVSAEPLLGPLNLSPWITSKLIDWVIVGGESGGRPGHPPRPMRPEWAASLRDQCAGTGVGFFFKQWGGRTPKSGGRLLDGRTWDEIPVDRRRP